ncbi:MAG: helix-turn-helix transcriptional regulator [Acidimicrobiaceae bacterium]|nr:helix-turn-helix transcriptional regulator [Acidimicrobiaceae bacterium]MCO5328922.1 helix-turn-helix domain-containing protein [Ilumatobacteraceae bacterium]
MDRITDPTEKQIGEHLRARRLAARWSQAELADLANVSIGALQHLESGAGANVTTLVKVVHALGAEAWFQQLAPTPSFSPLQLAEQRRQEREAPARRVRRKGPVS